MFERNLKEVDVALDASLKELSTRREELQKHEQLLLELNTEKTDLDAQISSMSTDIQSKEDELQRILEDKRAALDAKVLLVIS